VASVCGNIALLVVIVGFIKNLLHVIVRIEVKIICCRNKKKRLSSGSCLDHMWQTFLCAVGVHTNV